MKIAIIEFDYHFVDLYNFCKLFEFGPHELTVFTNKNIYERFLGDPISPTFKWVIKYDEKLSHFFKENISLINSHDVIFFNTIASGYSAILKTEFTSPTILRIHNSNSYLQPFRHIHIPKTLFDLYKSISYIFREMLPTLDFYLIPKIIKKLTFVCFTDYFVEEYVIRQNLIPRNKIFPCIPSATSYAINKEIDVSKKNLDICIPGAIDQRKRDYIPVIQGIKEAIPHLENRITLWLGGKPVGKYGEKVIEALKVLEHDKFHLQYFDSFVSQQEYNSILEHSDIIIAPMIKASSFRIYTEIYGKSKTSGSFLELVRYGKLTFFPTHFNTTLPLTDLLDKYDSSHSLSALLVNYGNNRTYFADRTHKLQQYLMQYYSPAKIIKEFEINCKTLL